jgi:hypothetical protein
MKKVFLVAAAALVATAGFSQVKYGGQVGGTFSSASMNKDEIGEMKKSIKPGFSAGFVSEITLNNSLTLRPSLNFMQKGVKMKGSGQSELGGVTGEMTVNLNYLELPVVLAYNIPMGDNKFYVGAGPSVGFGISGKYKSEFTMTIPGVPTQTQVVDADAFKDDEDGAGMKRLDVSANVIAGVQFSNGFFVNAGGLFGLTNLGDKESKYRNIGGQLTIGFLLNNK